jgi:hypothetical protein
MAKPYATGHPMIWLENDPDGVRIHHATVTSIEPSTQPDTWKVTTNLGTATVDHDGIGAHALPLDDFLATELYIKGDGYLITPSLIEHTLDADNSLDLGDDLGLE